MRARAQSKNTAALLLIPKRGIIINGFLNDNSDYQANRNEEIYSGENGNGEGKYWQRQNDNVSF